MDMTRHLNQHLQNPELQAMGGSYEGVLVDVLEENVYNKFRCQIESKLVLVFEDGQRSIPNQGMTRTLHDSLGSQTDDWLGQRLRISLQPDPRKKPDGLQKIVSVTTLPTEELSADDIPF